MFVSPGTGRNQQPDSAWRPKPRPQALLPNALLPLLPMQPNGDPYPSLVMEVGNSQSIPDLISIRDRMLSWRTAINVFVLIAYNRNATRAIDNWFLRIAVRDYLAPQPPPGTGADYPACTVLYETPKIGARYPRVITPSPKALKSTASILAISTTPRHPPSSTLLSRHHSELMLRKFVQPLSLTAAHK